jgi:hypothetical protein
MFDSVATRRAADPVPAFGELAASALGTHGETTHRLDFTAPGVAASGAGGDQLLIVRAVVLALVHAVVFGLGGSVGRTVFGTSDERERERGEGEGEGELVHGDILRRER